MRPALVDNLTLDAVQRILGQVISEYYDEGEIMIKDDIIAFDNLLNAILFSDEVVYIESFMPQDGNFIRRGEYFPMFRQFRMGIVTYRTIIKDINDEFALKYDEDIKNTPAFFAFEFMKPHLQLPAINRLEYGSMIYHTISANLGADLVLFPSRATFQKRFMEDLSDELKLKTFSRPTYKNFDVPMFIAYFAEEYKEPGDFIGAAYELRKEPEFQEARRRLEELRVACDSNSAKTVFQRKLATKALKRKMDEIINKYAVSVEGVKIIRNVTTAYNLKKMNQGFIPAPAMNYNTETVLEETPIEEIILSEITPREEHIVYLTNLVEDKKRLDKLGIIYDYIVSDLVPKGSEDAKLFNEAMLIREFEDDQKEAKALYEHFMSPIRRNPMNILDREDITLTDETKKALLKIKEQ